MEKAEKLVCVVGPRRVQNELLAALIAARTDIATRTFRTLSELKLPDNGNRPSSCLILKDAPSHNREELLELLPERTAQLDPCCLLALFNVVPGQAIEREAFTLGVRGFFYKEDVPDTLIRGVEALFDGELWMSRRTMSDCLLCGGVQRRSAPPAQWVLTPRETEILGMLATGISNDVMADRLCISLNTVKTHVYRIFRKLEVDNRLQAALWAAENL